MTKHKSINAIDIPLKKSWAENVSYHCSHGVREPLEIDNDLTMGRVYVRSRL